MEKVNCKICKKKKPHGHKGCNETGASRIQVGETKEIKEKKKKNQNIQIDIFRDDLGAINKIYAKILNKKRTDEEIDELLGDDE